VLGVPSLFRCRSHWPVVSAQLGVSWQATSSPGSGVGSDLDSEAGVLEGIGGLGSLSTLAATVGPVSGPVGLVERAAFSESVLVLEGGGERVPVLGSWLERVEGFAAEAACDRVSSGVECLDAGEAGGSVFPVAAVASGVGHGVGARDMSGIGAVRVAQYCERTSLSHIVGIISGCGDGVVLELDSVGGGDGADAAIAAQFGGGSGLGHPTCVAHPGP
jgi:hypothetical protein